MESVLHVPELARWIYTHSNREDFIHLSLTCRAVFPLAIPFAWENVKDVSRLFDLLGEDVVSTYEGEEEPLITELKLPEPLDEKAFARFNIYAPFVKNLEIFRCEYQQFVMANSQSLIDFAQTCELLPNLVSLTLQADNTRRLGYLFWTRIFASRSMLNIQAIYGKYDVMPVTSTERESVLMRTIVSRCPNVQKLAFFSFAGSSVGEHDLDTSFARDPTPMCTFLAKATSLTELIGSMSFLEHGALRAIGSLPNLRRLKIYYPHRWRDHERLRELKATCLPQTAFPQLNNLVLDDVLEHGVNFIWRMTPLVGYLSTVEIGFYPYPRRTQKEWALSEFIPLLCERSPHIRELVLEFDSLAYEGTDDPHMCKFSEGAFDAIAKLQLTRLEVLHARLHWETSLIRLADTWPQIEVLRWPAQHVKPQDLRRFAERLPKLRHLALEVDMDPLPETGLAGLTIVKHSTLQVLESGFHRISDLDPTAGASMCWFFLKLWPNAKLRTRGDTYADSLPGRRMDLFCVQTINNIGPFFEFHKTQFPELYEQDVDPRVYETGTLKHLALLWGTSLNHMLSDIESGNHRLEEPWRVLPAEALWT